MSASCWLLQACRVCLVDQVLWFYLVDLILIDHELSSLSLSEVHATHSNGSLTARWSRHFVLHVMEVHILVCLHKCLVSFHVLSNLIITELLLLINICIIISHVLLFRWILRFVFQIILTTMLWSFLANWPQILPWISVIHCLLVLLEWNSYFLWLRSSWINGSWCLLIIECGGSIKINLLILGCYKTDISCTFNWFCITLLKVVV